MLTTQELLSRHCSSQDKSGAMPEAEILAQLGAIASWRYADGQLQRRYGFRNYYQTIAFVNALAYLAHREDHHPDLRVGYDFCEMRFNTHSAGGITLNDFICAAKAEALFEHH